MSSGTAVELTYAVKHASGVSRKVFLSSNMLTKVSERFISATAPESCEKRTLDIRLGQASHCSKKCSNLF